MSDKKWNTSNYRQRKAERLALIKPEWVKNPKTGEEFCLRRVGSMSSMVAGYMPNELTNQAIAGWKEKGLEVETGTGQVVQVTPELIKEGERSLQQMARVLQQACVIPKLVPGATGDVEGEIDPADLDDDDVLFIYRWATGRLGNLTLKGGEVMDTEDLASFRKKPARRSRAGNGRADVQPAT